MSNESEIPIDKPRAVLLIVGFCVVIALGPLFVIFGARVHTRATPKAPGWNLAAFRDGSLTNALERHLVESSPLTACIRSVYSDLWMGLSLLETGDAVIGRGGMLFLRHSLEAAPGFVRDRAVRREFFSLLAARCRALDVQLLFVPVPDKERVDEALLPHGVTITAERRAMYAAVVEEARAAGLETLDLGAAMAAWRVARPEERLFHALDTHWTLTGCQRSAEFIAERLEQLSWIAGIPRAALSAQPSQPTRLEGDLVAQTGLSTDGSFSSLLISEPRFASILVRQPDGTEVPMAPQEPAAGVAVCGDSFAAAGLVPALAGHLGRLVDADGVRPSLGPRVGLDACLSRIERGELRAKVIVWEAIERSFGEDWWRRRSGGN